MHPVTSSIVVGLTNLHGTFLHTMKLLEGKRDLKQRRWTTKNNKNIANRMEIMQMMAGLHRVISTKRNSTMS